MSCLSSLKDPRRSQGLRTSLSQILTMSILSICCGSLGYRGISRFSKAYQKELTELLGLRHGVPSHVTFSTVIQKLSLSSLIEAFNKWAHSYCDQNSEDWLSSDGKVLGSTVSDCHNSQQNFQAIVSMFCQKSGLVYKLETYRNKDKESGEQSILRDLIAAMQDLGMIITVDALHTQKKPFKLL